MIRIISLVTIIIGLSFGMGFGHEPTEPELCPDAMTTAQMQICLEVRHQAADAALNRAYRQLMAKLETPRRPKLIAAQRAWVQFRDRSAVFEASGETGGSMAPLSHLSAMIMITERRAAEFRSLLSRME